MPTVRDVVTKFSFQVDGEKLAGLERQIGAIKDRLSFLSGVEIAKGLYHLAERFGGVGEEIKIAAAAAGLTVENFQKLSFAAQQNGVTQDELSRSLGLLAQSLYKARQGSLEAQKAFAEAGISPEQVASFKTSKDALLALSDVLKKEQDPIKRAALSRELLGRGSRKMAEFLGEGSVAIQRQAEEAKRLGLILSGPQIKALKDAENAFKKLFATMQAWGATIAAFVSPVIVKMVDDLLELFGANKKVIDLNIEAFLLRFAYAIGVVSGILQVVVIKFREFAGFLPDIKTAIEVFGAIKIGNAVAGWVAVAGAWSKMAAAAQIINATAPALIALGLYYSAKAIANGQNDDKTGDPLGALAQKLADSKLALGGKFAARLRSGGGHELGPAQALPFIPGGKDQPAVQNNYTANFNGMTHDEAVDKFLSEAKAARDSDHRSLSKNTQGPITR